MSETRIAVIAIIVDDLPASSKVNAILHKYSDIIVGRIGIPYRERQVSVISVVVDATPDIISAVTGQLGKIECVTVKAAVSNK